MTLMSHSGHDEKIALGTHFVRYMISVDESRDHTMGGGPSVES